jgi:hypothetical protein
MDLQRALRTVRRNPGYALTAALCLAVAMGVNAAFFTFLDGLLLRGLPLPAAGQMVHVNRGRPSTAAGATSSKSAVICVRWKPPQCWSLAATWISDARPAAEANYAQVLRIDASRGRWFPPEEDSPARLPVAVVSYRLWQEQWHSDPAVLGQQILFNDQPYLVIGVGPPVFAASFLPWRWTCGPR